MRLEEVNADKCLAYANVWHILYTQYIEASVTVIPRPLPSEEWVTAELSKVESGHWIGIVQLSASVLAHTVLTPASVKW